MSVIAVEAKPFDYHSVRGRQAVVQQKGIYEGEALQLRGTSRVQDMRGFGPAWSGDAHLLWLGEPGEVMETVFSVPAEGDYLFSLQMTKAPDYGIFSVGLNGRLIRKGVDLYSGKVELSDLVGFGEGFPGTGNTAIVIHPYRLKFQCACKGRGEVFTRPWILSERFLLNRRSQSRRSRHQCLLISQSEKRPDLRTCNQF